MLGTHYLLLYRLILNIIKYINTIISALQSSLLYSKYLLHPFLGPYQGSPQSDDGQTLSAYLEGDYLYTIFVSYPFYLRALPVQLVEIY